MSEDKDMQMPLNEHVGRAIKKHRQKKRLTRKQLTRADDPSRRICSEKTLERIERGEAAISAVYLDGFLEVLGVGYTEFYNEVEGPEMTLFHNGFSEVWDLLFDKKHEEAKTKMENLISVTTVDLGKPTIKQAIMLYNCRVSAERGDACMDELYIALYLTSPFLADGKGEIALPLVASNIFTLNEYRIMVVIAYFLERRGDMANSAEIYKTLICSLEYKTLVNETRNKLLPTVCYNLADVLTTQGKYGEAASISMAGLRHGNAVGNHKMDGALYYSLAKAQQLVGETVNAERNFNLSYSSFKAQGRKKWRRW